MTDDSEQSAARDPFATGAGLSLYAAVAPHSDANFIGRSLGDYRITALIAEGGMSRVYRAERTDGSFEREVAIKISPVSGFSESMRERFLREQGVLAGLNHPNVSQLYDAHVTEEGWPYIVMELIDGQPIDEYCETRDIDVAGRVRKLIEVVDAVAYAHARLVVHRDIKPSNVLVTNDGRPKLLDFGIAKLLEADQPALTRAGPMTPRYASPEQLLMQPITIASDVYQLGLLMFRVLTGEHANGDETLAAAIRRAADQRPVELAGKALDGLPRELVLIVEQCLRTTPEERYPDVNALRGDLCAWLDGYPVSAAGQGAGYRLRKLVDRNRPTAFTLAVAVLALVSGASWYTWQLADARAEAEAQAEAARVEAANAREVADFLTELLGASIPDKALGEDVTVRQVLDQGVQKVRDELNGQEPLKARLLATMGEVYNELGSFEVSGQLLDESIALYRGLDDRDPVAFAQAMYFKGMRERYEGRLESAETWYLEAAAEAARSQAPRAWQLLGSLHNALGVAASKLNRFDESIRHYEVSLEYHEKAYGSDHYETSVPIANLAMVYRKLGRLDEASRLLEYSVDIADRELGPVHPWISARLINLSGIHTATGRFTDAEPLILRALEIDRQLYGEDHHYIANDLLNLAGVYRELGDYAEAARLVEQALPIETASVGEHQVDTGNTRYQLAGYYIELGRLDEATELLAVADGIFAESLPEKHTYRADIAGVYAKLHAARGEPFAALAANELAIGMHTELYDDEHPYLIGPLLHSADVHASLGEYGRSVDYYARALDIFVRVRGEVHPLLPGYFADYADALEGAGQTDEAASMRARVASLAALSAAN